MLLASSGKSVDGWSKRQLREEAEAGHGSACGQLCESLSDPLVLLIFSYLNKASLLQCTEVSRRCSILATDCSLRVWQSLAVYRQGHFAARLQASRYSAAKSAYFAMECCVKEIEAHGIVEMPRCLDFLALSGGMSEDYHEDLDDPTAHDRSSYETHARALISTQQALTQLAVVFLPGLGRDFIRSLPSPCLVSLCLNGCIVTDACLNCIATNCPLLQDLIMFETLPEQYFNHETEEMRYRMYSTAAVAQLLQRLAGTLRRLEVGGSWNTSDEYKHLNKDMFLQGGTCTALLELCLGNMTGVDDAALGALVHCAPNLEKLILEGCGITKAGLLSHIGSLTHLKYLDIREARFLFKGESRKARASGRFLLGRDMQRLAAALPCIEVLMLKLDDRGADGRPNRRSWEQLKQDRADIVAAFRHCQGHAVPLLGFDFPIRCIRAGRQHCWLSWFEGRMEGKRVTEHRLGGGHCSATDYIATDSVSEEHCLDSLRDFNATFGLWVKEGSFVKHIN